MAYRFYNSGYVFDRVNKKPQLRKPLPEVFGKVLILFNRQEACTVVEPRQDFGSEGAGAGAVFDDYRGVREITVRDNPAGQSGRTGSNGSDSFFVFDKLQ